MNTRPIFYIIHFVTPFMAEMKQIRDELGNVRDVDGKHSEEVLGFEFIPADQCVEDTVRSLVDHGIVKF